MIRTVPEHSTDPHDPANRMVPVGYTKSLRAGSPLLFPRSFLRSNPAVLRPVCQRLILISLSLLSLVWLLRQHKLARHLLIALLSIGIIGETENSGTVHWGSLLV